MENGHDSCSRPELDEAPPCCREAGGGPVRATILAVAVMLSISEQSVHGYELLDRADSLVGRLVSVDKGSVYRLLRSFDEQGLLDSNWEEQDSGPPRRVYHLTAQGTGCLASMTGRLKERAGLLLELAEQAEEQLGRVPPTPKRPADLD